jgi:hypothetical protein
MRSGHLMSLILVEYVCDGCAERYESLEERPAPSRVLHACGCSAERVLSAPKPKIVTVRPTPVSRGRYEERPGPRAMDTRALADGASMDEFKAKRRKVWQEQRYQQVKREVG